MGYSYLHIRNAFSVLLTYSLGRHEANPSLQVQVLQTGEERKGT